ncbi:annexin A11 [Drosophila teissieri]|uniref:annexin A11 n=1 Tax=Drosophila teissieri TaxID=7243 RepID=UPI001CBA130F|nr:annexin A11 [Drosophila teissieri]
MKSCVAIGVLLVLVLQYGVVRVDGDSSDSSSSSSGEKNHKYTTTEHKYNYPAYGGAGYMPPFPMYPYPMQYPTYPGYPPVGGYPPYPYNPYMPPPAPQVPQPAPPSPMYPPGPYGYQGGYPPQTGPGQNGAYPNALPNQPQPQQSAPGAGSGNAPNYPPGGSSVINHSLKVNKEYNEDGHHQSST